MAATRSTTWPESAQKPGRNFRRNSALTSLGGTAWTLFLFNLYEMVSWRVECGAEVLSWTLGAVSTLRVVVSNLT